MIVNSMSRKAPTFAQLVGYIGQDGEGGKGRCFSRNLFYDGQDTKTISQQFWNNYQYLPARKNGNALYHELIVLQPQPHLTDDQVTQVLLDLAREYTKRRAPNQLAWGRVHFDTKYPHLHLMLSANDVRGNRRKRLDKASFDQIQKDLELYKEQRWPELIDERVYNKSRNDNIKIKSSEGEFVRRTGKPSNKMQLAQTLATLLSHHQDMSAFQSDLSRAGYELYQRGKQWGVVNVETGKKHRLKTLGLSDSFEAFRRVQRLKSHQLDKQPPRLMTCAKSNSYAAALIWSVTRMSNCVMPVMTGSGIDETDQ